jgi:hypothetical protein
MFTIEKDVEKKNYYKTCSICGCKQYSNNYARHLKTKKHKQVDYANQKFEITKYEPPQSKKTEYLILR